jgi:hypothetical protein
MATNPADLIKDFDQTGVSDDPYPFANAPQQSVGTSDQPPPPQGWWDLAKDTGKAVVGSSEQQIGNMERYFGSTIDDYDLSKSWRDSGNAWNKSGQDWMGSMSAAGQQTTNAPIFSNETWQHPFNKLVMGVGKGGLFNLAMIPGGGAAAMVGRAALGAALSYTGSYGDVVDTIRNVPDDQLQKASEPYRELRKIYPEFQAKPMLADQAWDQVSGVSKAITLGTGALAGEAGPLATVGKTIAGTGGSTLAKLAEGKWAGRGLAAAETGGIQAGQYAGSAIPTRQALTSVGAPADTPSDIAWSSIEQGAIGAVIGGGGRFFRPQGGKNEANSKDTTGRAGGVSVDQVPAGQADPAEAAALQSAVGTQQELPLTGGKGQAPPPRPAPPPAPTLPRGPYQQPLPLDYWRAPSNTEQAPIPPRPSATYGAFTPPPRQGELPLEQPAQPPQRQGELPLQSPQPPVEQPTLSLAQPRQPVTQLGLPGMGADVTHAPGEDISRPPEVTPKPPEPTPAPAPTAPKGAALKKGKVASTKDSDEVPAETAAKPVKASDLPSGTAKWIGEPDKTAAHAADMAEREKTAAQTAINATVARGKPEIPRDETSTVARSTSGKRLGEFDTSKIGTEAPAAKPTESVTQPVKGAALKKGTGTFKAIGETAEAPAVQPAKLTRTQAMQAAVEARLTKLSADKFQNLLLHGKIKKASPTEIMAAGEARKQPIYQHPTTKEYYVNTPVKEASVAKAEPVKGEPKVTVIPPTAAQLKPTVLSKKTLEIAAEFAAKPETTRQGKAKGKQILKNLKDIGAALGGKKRDITDVLQRAAALPDEKEAGVKGEGLKRGKIAQARDKVIKSIEDASPKELAAGNYKMEHPDPADTQGVPVTITGPGGLEGDAAGRIKGTTVDNIPHKPLDAILASEKDNGNYHVVNRLEDGRFKDHVVVLGADDMEHAYEHAIADERKNNPGMSRNEALERIGGIVQYTKPEFEHWLKNGDRNQEAYPLVEGHPQGIIHDISGDYKTLGSSTLHTALHDNMLHVSQMDEYKPLYNVFKWWSDNVSAHIPDVPVYYTKQKNVHTMAHSNTTDAFYNTVLNHIVIGDEMDNPPEITILHEAGHAVTSHLYNGDKEFRALTDWIHAEYRLGLLDRRETAATSNVEKGGEELLADWVNPRVARQLQETEMSPKLADALGMDEWKGAAKTLWNGIIKAFGDAMERMFGVKLPGGENKYTLLDGIMRMHDMALTARKEGPTLREAYRDAKVTKDSDSPDNIIKSIERATHDKDRFERDKTTLMKSTAHKAMEVMNNYGMSGFKGGLNFLSLDENNRYNAHLWGSESAANPLTVLTRTHQMMDHEAQTISAEKTALEKEGLALRGKYDATGPWNDLITLIQNSHTFGYHPDEPISQGRNAHIVAGKLNDQSITQYNTVGKPIWDRLQKEAPDLARYYQTARDLYKKDGDAMSQNKMQWALKGVDSRNDWGDVDRDKFIKEALTGKLSDSMKEWAKEKGIIHSVDEATELIRNPGPYFPSSREGTHTVSARFNLKVPENADLLDHNTLAFKTFEEANAYRNAQKLYGEIKQSKDPAQEGGDMYKPWLVRMNDQYYSTHETLSKAKKIAEDLLSYYDLDKSSIKVEDKREHSTIEYELAGPLTRRLMGEANKLTNYSVEERQRFKDMLMDTAPIAQTRGGFTSHMLQRRNVVGADRDILTSFGAYNRGFAVHMARVKYGDKIDQAIKALEDAHNTLSKGGYDENAYKRSMVLNRMTQQLNQFGSARYMGTDLSPAIRDLIEITGIKTLGSIGHIVLHPLRLSYGAARLMGEFGTGAAWKMAKYQRIFGWPLGGTLGAFKGAGRTLMGDLDTFDAHKYLMQRLARLPNGKELQSVLEALESTTHTHGAMNIDLSLYHEEGNMFRRMMSRADTSMRQVMGIGEAVNRATIGLSAYEAAIAKGLSKADAIERARNIVSRSMGKFGAGERPLALQHPLMRIPLQLRGWGLSTAKALFEDLVRVRRGFGGSKEERIAAVEAFKSLTYSLMAASAVAGFTGMIPGADVLKLATRASKALGITNTDYEDWENELRKQAVDTFGPYWGRVLAEGFPAGLGPFSVAAGGRLGLQSLFIYNLPDMEKSDSTWAAIGKLMGGAALETAGGMWEGTKDILKGDLFSAAGHMIPVKQIDDAVKAYKGATVGQPTEKGYAGLPPYGLPQTIMQLIGIVPAEVHEYQEAKYYAGRELTEEHDKKMNILNEIAVAKVGSAQTQAMLKVSAYNMQHPEARITPSDIASAKKRSTVPSMLGMPVTKKTRGTLQNYSHMYGFGSSL